MEDVDGVLQHCTIVGFASRDQVELFLNCRSHRRLHEVDVNLLVAMYQHNPKRCRLQLATGSDVYVVAFAHVVDVNGNAGVSADAVFLHQRNQLGFG